MTGKTTSAQLSDLNRFYNSLDLLEKKLGGKRLLGACDGRMQWPSHGVYFFFEPGEVRTEFNGRLRVVRVGTHAVSIGSETTLWKRLAQHRGSKRSGGGSHRASVFRLLIGAALARRDPALACPAWGKDRSNLRAVLDSEQVLERMVSAYIGSFSLVCLPADDSPSKASLRRYIERNAIALLSNVNRAPHEVLDPPSPEWLGSSSHQERVRTSGLWNVDHVHEIYDPEFLSVLEHLVQAA